MAERTIDYKITAKDEASGVFSRFSRNLQKSVRDSQAEAGKILGPTLINRQMLSSSRTVEEQSVRDLMANRIKGMRRAAAEERIKAIAEEKLFGTQLSATMRQTNQRIARELTGLDRIKSILGARGSVKNVAELFVGGGAIAAVGFITHAIANAARNARELTDEFRDGKIQAGEFADKLVGTIPVLGAIWRAGRDIREMITGEQRLIAEATKQAEAMNLAMQARLNIQKLGNDAQEKQLETLRQINREIQTRIMGPTERATAESGFASTDARRQAVADAKAQIEAIAKARDEAIRKAGERRNELNLQLGGSLFAGANPRARQAHDAEQARIKSEIGSLSKQIAAIGKDAADQIIEVEKRKQELLKAVEKNGLQERAKIRGDAAMEAVHEFLKSTNAMLGAANDYNQKAVTAEREHQQRIRQLRDETFRRYMSQYNAAMRMAEGEFRKGAPGRGTATPVEVRFATRVGSPEDSARRTTLDELRKAAGAAVNTQKIVNDILRTIQTMTGIGQAQYEIFGNN